MGENNSPCIKKAISNNLYFVIWLKNFNRLIAPPIKNFTIRVFLATSPKSYFDEAIW
jgi:hypothetical protein